MITSDARAADAGASFDAMHRETRLTSLALYQQALRTTERVKTLMREIDEVSREVHQHLDDLDIILEQIQGKKRDVSCNVEKDSRCAVSVQNTAFLR